MLAEADKSDRLRLFGEDTCDLVSTIEESFGVKFDEDELVEATTVGALAGTVFKKLRNTDSRRCLSAITFYELRLAFVQLFAVPRSRIHPATSLYDLMPWKTREKQWREVQDRLNYVLPQLVWPVWLLVIALLLAGSIPFCLFRIKASEWLGVASVPLGIVAVLTVLVLVFRILGPLARQLPRSCETFGDLATHALARNYNKLAVKYGTSSEKEVSQSLLRLAAVETGIDVSKLSRETRFPEELGIY